MNLSLKLSCLLILGFFFGSGFSAHFKTTADRARDHPDEDKTVSLFFRELFFRHLMRLDDLPVADVVEL